jgi:tetratricopeptide (TPR) repeat protein
MNGSKTLKLLSISLLVFSANQNTTKAHQIKDLDSPAKNMGKVLPQLANQTKFIDRRIKHDALIKLLQNESTRGLLPISALKEADKGNYNAALAIIKKEALNNKNLMNWVEQNSFDTLDAKSYGLALLKAGDLTGAVKYLKQAVNESPKDLQVTLGLADALEKKGDIYSAVPYLRTALRIDPDNQFALSHLARILSWGSATHSEAESLLARKIRLNPNDLGARLELATIESWNKSTWPKAIAEFKIVVKQDRNNTEAKLALARLLSWVGRFREAEPIYSSYLAQKPGEEIARREFAKLLSYHSDSWPEAIRQYDQCLKLNALDLEAAYERALLLAYTHRADESIKELERLSSINPFGMMRSTSAYGLRRARPILFTLAQVQNWSSNWTEAEKNLRRYLTKAPDDWGAQLELANCLSSQSSRVDESLSLLNDVLAAHPDCASAQSERAMLQAIRGSTDEALPVLRAIASRDPFGHADQDKKHSPSESSGFDRDKSGEGYSTPILNLARVAAWANLWQESEQAYRTYLAKYPDDGKIRLEMAKILSYQPKRMVDAMKEYDQILQKDPQNKSALLQRLVLEAISGRVEEATLALKQIVDDQSLASLDQLTNVTSKEQSAILQLARLLSWTPHVDDAEKYYRQYLTKYPDDKQVLLELATLLSYKTEKQSEAITAFSSIMENSENTDKDLANRAKFRRAITLAWQKHYNQALVDLDSLITSGYQDALSDQVQSAYLTPLLAKAQILTWAGQRALSEETYEKYLATETGAKDRIAKLELAELYGQRQETYQKAMALLNTLLETDRNDFLTRQARAKMLVRMGDLEPASREFDELLSEHPAYIELHKQAALAGELTGRNEVSMQHWQQILALRPYDPEATLAVVLALNKDHCLQAAEKLACASLSKNPTSVESYVALALVLHEKGLDSRSNQLVDQAIATGQTKDLLDIANQLSGPKAGRHLAATICQKILDKEPENARANLLLACIEIWSVSERPKGIAHLQHYLKLHPDDLQAEAFLAEVYSWGKNRKESLNILDKLITKNPNNLDLRNQRAKVLTWTGKLSQAIQEYKTVLAIDNKNVAALVGLGQCANYNGDYFRAEKYLKLARQQDQKDAQAQLVSAMNFNQMGRVDKALAHLQTVLKVAHEPRGFTFSTLEGENDN